MIYPGALSVCPAFNAGDPGEAINEGPTRRRAGGGDPAGGEQGAPPVKMMRELASRHPKLDHQRIQALPARRTLLMKRPEENSQVMVSGAIYQSISKTSRMHSGVKPGWPGKIEDSS